MFKKKLIITLLVVAGGALGISVKSFPIFHNVHTTPKMSHASNIKENHVSDEKVDSKSTSQNDTDKNLDSSSNTENSSDDSKNNNSEAKKEETIHSKLEKSSSNNTDNQSSVQSQPENNTNSQVSTNTTPKVEAPVFRYDRTTSIYANDNVTLLRVEYYLNNKLTYYSVIEQFDVATKSYIEKIYQCNLETNIDPFIRTDVYVNGTLVKSY